MVHPANHSHFFFQNFPTVLWNWFSAAQAGSKIPVSLRAELWWAKDKTQAGFYRTGMETDAIGIHWSSCRNEPKKNSLLSLWYKYPQIPTEKKHNKTFNVQNGQLAFYTNTVMDIWGAGIKDGSLDVRIYRTQKMGKHAQRQISGRYKVWSHSSWMRNRNSE